MAPVPKNGLYDTRFAGRGGGWEHVADVLFYPDGGLLDRCSAIFRYRAHRFRVYSVRLPGFVGAGPAWRRHRWCHCFATAAVSIDSGRRLQRPALAARPPDHRGHRRRAGRLPEQVIQQLPGTIETQTLIAFTTD